MHKLLLLQHIALSLSRNNTIAIMGTTVRTVCLGQFGAALCGQTSLTSGIDLARTASLIRNSCTNSSSLQLAVQPVSALGNLSLDTQKSLGIIHFDWLLPLQGLLSVEEVRQVTEV